MYRPNCTEHGKDSYSPCVYSFFFFCFVFLGMEVTGDILELQLKTAIDEVTEGW